MKCPNCGQENNARALFCDNCGKVLAAKTAGHQSQPEHWHTPAEDTMNRRRTSPLVSCLMVGCAVVLVVLIVLLGTCAVIISQGGFR
jgi:uncharacterized membrane protein YvbJ